MKEAIVPVNKGVVSYSQTFMLAQASHIGFPFWSLPLYPRPTRIQTPSYKKRHRRKMRKKYYFFGRGRGEVLTLCSVESAIADGENGLKA